MSTISAGTTLTTALVQTGDTTGALVIKTNNGNTTAATFSTAGNLTVAGTITANGSAITSSQWTTSGSNIYYNTGNVLVGTTTSAAPLTVIKSVSSDNVTYIQNTNTTAGTSFGLALAAGTNTSDYALKIINAAATSELMRVDGSGNVGIGTSSPRGKLDVVGRSYFQPASGTSVITLLNTSGGDGSIQVSGTSTTMNYGFNTYSTANALYIQNDGSVGIGTASPDVFSRGETRTLGITSSGSTSIGINAATGNNPSLYLGVNGTRTIQLVGNSSTPSIGTGTGLPLLFATDFTTRMTLDTSGNLGIGTSSPNGKLTVSNGSTQNIEIQPSYIQSFNRSSPGYADLTFYCNNFIASAGGSERMRIDSSGNVQLSTAGTSILNSSGRKMLNQTGGILQVVNATLTTCFSTTSTSYVDSGLTVNITPSSTSSKILIQIGLNDISKSDAGLVGFNIVRNGTTLIYNTTTGTGSTYQAWNTFGGFSQTRVCAAASLSYLDSPASTSALTYKVQVKVEGGTGYLNQWGLNTDASAVSFITVMEIAG